MVGRRVIDHVEVHASAKGRRLHLFERYLLHFHINLGRGRIGDESLDDVVLTIGIENAIGELAVEEVEGFREIILNRVAIAAVVEGAKLRQKIFRFRILGFVFEVVVVDGLGPPEIVNANHQRAEILKGANGFQIDQSQARGHQRNEDESNLQVGVGHHGIPVLFEVEPLGVLEVRVALHPSTFSMSTADDPPEVPLKM